MHLQGMCATIVSCVLLVGCNSRQDKEVVADSLKQPSNTEKQESPLSLATKSPAATLVVEEWTSNPVLQAKLGEEKSDANFAYRLPPGFRWIGGSGNARTFFIGWQGEPRSDKSAAEITILTGRLYPAIKDKPLEQAAADQLKTDQQRFRNVVPGKGSLGTINGIPFYKTTFTMDDPDTSLHGRVMVYHGHFGNHYIHLVLSDVEPYLNETEKLLEAAALSVLPK